MGLRSSTDELVREWGRSIRGTVFEFLDPLHLLPIPDWMRPVAPGTELAGGSRLGTAIVNVASLFVGAFSIMGRYADAAWGQRFQQYDKQFRPGLIAIEPTLEALRRGHINSAQAAELLRLHGYPEDQVGLYLGMVPAVLSGAELVTAIVENQLPRAEGEALGAKVGLSPVQMDLLIRTAGAPPGPETLLDLLNRGDITEAEVDQGLRESRLKDKWIEAVKKTRFYVPSPPDLIRYAVREVFDSKLSAELGLTQEFPEQFAKEAEKRGMSREHALWAWAAHWELPSPTMGYNMLHRKIISPERLAALLRAHDYSPVWRKELQELSYHVIGRVDIRRLNADGIITDAELPAFYEKQGSSPEDAQRLANWTIKYNLEHGEGKKKRTKDLSEALIRTAYRDSIISQDEFHQSLIDLGYDEDEARIVMLVEDFSSTHGVTRELEAALKKIYILRQMDTDEVVSRLREAGYDDARIEKVMAPWQLLRHSRELTEEEKRHRDETVSMILATMEEGTYTEEVAREHLELLGYSAEVAGHIVANAKVKHAKARKKEAIDYVHTLYLGGQIDQGAAESFLDTAGMNPEQRDAYIVKWEIEKKRQHTKLSNQIITQLWGDKVITKQQAAEEFALSGYLPKHVDWLLQQMTKGALVNDQGYYAGSAPSSS